VHYFYRSVIEIKLQVYFIIVRINSKFYRVLLNIKLKTKWLRNWCFKCSSY